MARWSSSRTGSPPRERGHGVEPGRAPRGQDAEDGTHRRENITDWALEQFRSHYHDPSITKWDIFYYVWLKVLLNWPATLLDWDVLFLIPVAWASPVLYPVLVSTAMFAFAVAILYRGAQGRPLVVTPVDVLGWLAAGMSEEQILADYPELQKDDFRAVYEYAARLGRRVAL